MRVAIVAPQPSPYVFGGAQRLWRGLASWINDHTSHDAELVDVESPEQDLETVLATYEACSVLDLGRMDLVISSKYPGWMVEHDHHVVYMLHTLRGLYDTYPGEHLPFTVDSDDPVLRGLLRVLARPPDRAAIPEVFNTVRRLMDRRGAEDPVFALPGPLARMLVHYLDAVGLDPSGVSAYFSLSRTVATRNGYFPSNVHPRVVFPPSDLSGLRTGRQDHIVAPSRLDRPKRHILLVQAMRFVEHDIALKIPGVGPELDRLVTAAGNDRRIEFVGQGTDEELAALYADALAVPFVPRDEDFGLVALEAMMSAKPVVTCFDSGGPTELINDRVSGLVVQPDPLAIAGALNTLIEQRPLARRLGMHARRRAGHVTWERLASALLNAPRRPRPPSRTRSRPRLLALSVSPVHPPLGGGQLRSHHLYRGLVDDADVEFISLGPVGEGSRRSVLAPGFAETIVPKSRAHQAEEDAFFRAAGIPVTDIVAGRLLPLTPAYLEVLEEAAVSAEAIILSHPFLHGAASALDRGIPLVYDAQDAEIVLKRATLPSSPVRNELLDLVRTAEERALRDAVLVAVCSADDIASLRREYGDFMATLIPNGVDTAAIDFVPIHRRTRLGRAWRRAFAQPDRKETVPLASAFFLGSWHPPNVEAVAHLVEVARTTPDVMFLIGGSVCNGYTGTDTPSNVRLLGVLSDTTKRRMLASCDIALNPMTSGTGTNLKLLEYFAAGIPTVSTIIGTRGIDTVDDRHLLVREIDEFGPAIRRLLDDRDLAERLVGRARALVEDEYDWSALGGRFADTLRARVPTLRTH